MEKLVTKAELRELRQKAKAARADAIKAENEQRDAKDRARDLAEKRVAIEAELDLQEWAHAQLDLGFDEDAIDLEQRIVTVGPDGRPLPKGPTFNERPGG